MYAKDLPLMAVEGVLCSKVAHYNHRGQQSGYLVKVLFCLPLSPYLTGRFKR
jgi:hypothetical protein